MNLFLFYLLFILALANTCCCRENLLSAASMLTANSNPPGRAISPESLEGLHDMKGLIQTDASHYNTPYIITPSMTMKRKQVHYLSCGTSNFGNSIPTDYNDFVLRLGSAVAAFRQTNSSQDENFDSSLPVEWSSSYKRVRWSEMAKQIQLPIHEFTSFPDTYKSDDLRYLMPAIKIEVKADKTARAYDVFLFSTEKFRRPSGASIFRMGIPQSRFVINPVADTSNSAKNTDSQPTFEPSSLEKPQLDTQPNAGHVAAPVMGLSNNNWFLAFAPPGVEQSLQKTKDTMIQEQADHLVREEQEIAKRLKQQADLAVGAISGVASLIGDSSTAQLHKDISSIVKSVTDQTTTPGEQLSRTISNIPSGKVTVADIESAINNVAEATGKKQFRRLQDASLESEPFLIAELSVFDTAGNVVYRPVSMHCPYMSIPMENLDSADAVLVFQVTFRTVDGVILSDDLDRTFKVKKFIFNEVVDDKIDDLSLCPRFVLGARLLDIDFDDFTKNTATRIVVRHVLAESLGITRDAVTFCASKKGSTIIGFDAGSHMTQKWKNIVVDPGAPIHGILQLDTNFNSLVSKDTLLGEQTPLPINEKTSGGKDSSNVLLSSSNHGEEPASRQRESVQKPPLILPIYDSEEIHEYDAPGQKFISNPATSMKESVTTLEEGIPTWAWALIGVGIVFVVGVLLALVVLYVVSHRKLKNDYSEKSLDNSKNENDNCGNNLKPGISENAGLTQGTRSPVAHREGRRHYDG